MTYLDLKALHGACASSDFIIPAVVATSATPSGVDLGQTVICGDALDVMSAMQSGSVDAVVTSPPYNVGVAYRSYDDRKTRDDYLDWMDAVAGEVARLLHANGAAFINLGGRV